MFVSIAVFIIAANVGYGFYTPSTRYILNVNKMVEDIDSSSESNDTTNRKITIRQYSDIPPRFSSPKNFNGFHSEIIMLLKCLMEVWQVTLVSTHWDTQVQRKPYIGCEKQKLNTPGWQCWPL